MLGVPLVAVSVSVWHGVLIVGIVVLMLILKKKRRKDVSVQGVD